MSEGTTAFPVSPFNPEDAMSVQSFMASIADTIVQASQLAKTVKELRWQLDALKDDVDKYHAENVRMDKEIIELRDQRNSARADNENLRETLRRVSDERDSLQRDKETLSGSYDALASRNDSLCADLAQARKERDDAQMKVMELEDRLDTTLRDSINNVGEAKAEAEHWKSLANVCQSKLDTLRSVFA